jgi:hypothetical protein
MPETEIKLFHGSTTYLIGENIPDTIFGYITLNSPPFSGNITDSWSTAFSIATDRSQIWGGDPVIFEIRINPEYVECFGQVAALQGNGYATVWHVPVAQVPSDYLNIVKQTTNFNSHPDNFVFYEIPKSYIKNMQIYAY